VFTVTKSESVFFHSTSQLLHPIDDSDLVDDVPLHVPSFYNGKFYQYDPYTRRFDCCKSVDTSSIDVEIL
jgi:hypothetical protein